MIYKGDLVDRSTPVTDRHDDGFSASSAIAEQTEFVVKAALELLTEEQRTFIKENRPAKAALSTVLQDSLAKADELKETTSGFKVRMFRKTISVSDLAENVFNFIKKMEPAIDLVTGLDPVHAGLPWSVIKIIINAGLVSFNQRATILQGLAYVLTYTDRVKVYIGQLSYLKPSRATTNFSKSIIDTYACILRFLATVNQTWLKKSPQRFVNALLWPSATLDKFLRDIEQCRTCMIEDANNCAAELQHNGDVTAEIWRNSLNQQLQELQRLETIESDIKELVEDSRLATLGYARGARWDSAEQGDNLCLLGTSQNALQLVHDHLHLDDERIVWLSGKAGTGKSTIARTIAHDLDAQDENVISFFFKRNTPGRDHAALVIPTLVLQLKDIVPDMTTALVAALKKSGNREANITTQFSELLEKPLRAARTYANIKLVLDAHDECESTSASTVFELFRNINIPGVNFNLLITSRASMPVTDPTAELTDRKQSELILEDVQQQFIESDIHHFLKHRFEELRPDLEKKSLKGWPGDEEIAILTKIATPLFIAASTFCMFIPKKNPKKQYQSIIEHKSSLGMGKVYEPVLEAMLAEEDDSSKAGESLETFRQVVGSFVIVFEPQSAASLGELLALDVYDFTWILGDLSSVLHYSNELEDLVFPFHASFRDFLINDGGIFHIDEAATHRLLRERSYQLLRRDGTLLDKKPDMARSLTTDQIREKFPRLEYSQATRYAAKYWILHAAKSVKISEDCSSILEFLKSNFLSWLEHLILQDDLTHLFNNMARLHKVVASAEVTDDEHGHQRELDTFLLDAMQILIDNRAMLTEYPLQTVSALHFAADENSVKQCYKETTEKHLDSIFEHYSPALRKPSDCVVWRSPYNIFTACASADRQYIALMRRDGQILHCRAATGYPLVEMDGHLPENKWASRHLAYSRNNTLTSIVNDLVQVWSCDDGSKLEAWKTGGNVVALSSTGDAMVTSELKSRLTFADTNNADTEPGAEHSEPGIIGMPVSDDLKCLILRDTDQAKLLKEDVHSDDHVYVTFSQNGKSLAIHHSQHYNLNSPPAPEYPKMRGSPMAVFSLEIWTIHPPKHVNQFTYQSQQSTLYCISEEGDRIAYFTDNWLYVKRVQDGHELLSVDLGHRMKAIVFDGEDIVGLDFQGQIARWPPGSTTAKSGTYLMAETVYDSLVINFLDSTRLVITNNNGDSRLRRETKVTPRMGNGQYNIDAYPDRFYRTLPDGKVQCWDAIGKLLWETVSQEGPVTLCVSSKFVATSVSAQGGTMFRLWDDAGRLVHEMQAGPQLNSLSPDGRVIATNYNSVQVHNLADKSTKTIYGQPDGTTFWTAISPDAIAIVIRKRSESPSDPLHIKIFSPTTFEEIAHGECEEGMFMFNRVHLEDGYNRKAVEVQGHVLYFARYRQTTGAAEPFRDFITHRGKPLLYLPEHARGTSAGFGRNLCIAHQSGDISFYNVREDEI